MFGITNVKYYKLTINHVKLCISMSDNLIVALYINNGCAYHRIPSKEWTNIYRHFLTFVT